MTNNDVRETLDILACEIELRPREAPSLADLEPFLNSRERSAGAITLNFASNGADAVAAFVAAERTCCSTIGWDLRRNPTVTLTITATAEQLDALERLFDHA